MGCAFKSVFPASSLPDPAGKGEFSHALFQLNLLTCFLLQDCFVFFLPTLVPQGFFRKWNLF